jgi:hypothetical protein
MMGLVQSPPPSCQPQNTLSTFDQPPRRIITLPISRSPRHNSPNNLSTSPRAAAELPYNYHYLSRMVADCKRIQIPPCLPACPTCRSFAKPTCLNSPKLPSCQSMPPPLPSVSHLRISAFFSSNVATDRSATAAMRV